MAISTVSRVINASSEVSDVTRGRVQAAIRKLQFQPQRTARTLAQKSTTSVAVALPSATSLFFVEMLKGVKDALREKDIDLLLCNLGSVHPYPTLRRFLDRGAVDALLLMALPIEDDATDQLLSLQTPVVLLGSRHPDLDAYWWDDEAGAYRATQYLLEQGHTCIGLISAQAWSTNAAPRLEGYARALREAGLEVDRDLIVSGQTVKHAGYSEEAGAEAMEELLALEDRPTAVFAASDVQAYGAWAQARDRGVRVPRDLSHRRLRRPQDEPLPRPHVGVPGDAPGGPDGDGPVAVAARRRVRRPARRRAPAHAQRPRLLRPRPPVTLPPPLSATALEVGTRYQGKVRDTYALGDGRIVLVTTDRISAFDHVLRQAIPLKGQVLNRVAAFFFEQTADVADNHVLEVPDPNVTVGVACEPLPIEFVVRGYLAGHAWRVYRDGGREICGETLPDGLRESQALPSPILTPATKAVEGHDEDVSRAEILDRGLLTPDALEDAAAKALALFQRGTEIAAERGLILVDTKYEFGRAPDGRLLVIDEVHTPDSSRYYYAEGYRDRLEAGTPQRQLSKEFVREWLMDHGFRGLEGQTLPDMPPEFVEQVSARYVELYETVTGRPFVPDLDADPARRVADAVQAVL